MPISVETTQPMFGGFTKETPLFRQPGMITERDALGSEVRALNQPEFGFKSQRPGTVDLTETAKSLEPLKKGLDVGTETGAMAKLNNMQSGFLAKNGENVGVEDAMRLKRNLDDLAGNIYLKANDAKSALKAEAYENMANNLRKQIYKIDPELGNLAAQESLMIRIRTGLKPVVAEAGGSRLPFGFWSTMVNAIEGSRATNFAGKALNFSMGTPSTRLAPAMKQTGRTAIGLPLYRDED